MSSVGLKSKRKCQDEEQMIEAVDAVRSGFFTELESSSLGAQIRTSAAFSRGRVMEKESSSRRMAVVARHLRGQLHQRLCSEAEEERRTVVSSIPKRRQEKIKWNGWGYEGTELTVDDGVLKFHGGERYSVGDINLTDYFLKWIEKMLDLKLADTENKMKNVPLPKKYPPSTINQEFMEEIRDLGMQYSLEGEDRLVRAHGQTLHEVALLRGMPWCVEGICEGSRARGDPLSAFPRIPDIVLWPEKHDHVERVVAAAHKHQVVLIPFGGGTNVTRAVVCSLDEHRMIVSLDTSQMNHILWINDESLLACVESGIIGQDLERELNAKGFTTGHEPDSYEFSSLGGWVATRASGMKKNAYGNIEDILVHVKMVTPTGVLQRNCRVPRISCGPDMNHLILGSEGTLGVVTEVVLKLRPLPETNECGSLIFKDLETGINFLWEVARQRCQPASLRLIDNEQYKMGQFFQEKHGVLGTIAEFAKMQYLTKIKGIDADSMCVAILVFEGTQGDVEYQEKKVYDIAVQKFGGILAGRRNGERGYKLTFAIAYVRDFCLSFGVLGDSFETSVPWEKTLSLCRNVKYRVAQECKKWGISHFIISCRVTQVYDAGSCVYFYLAFNARDIITNNTGETASVDPFHVFHDIEEKARAEILATGGSLSHHHGIGKVRRQWYEGQVSEAGKEVYRAVKRQLDPNNIFAVRNIDDQ